LGQYINATVADIIFVKVIGLYNADIKLIVSLTDIAVKGSSG
jgi:hypothetical protein